jgi:hypothetical protein
MKIRMTRFFAPDATDGGLPPSLGEVDELGADASTGGLSTERKPTDLSELGTPLPPTDEEEEEKTDKGTEGAQGKDSSEEDKQEPPVGDESEITPDTFFGEMEKLSGVKYEVKYPDDVDPLSPAGFVHRENAIREKAMDDYAAFLQKSDPRAYAYFIHRQLGKPDEEFYATKQHVSLPPIADLETSVDLQRTVYRNDLIAKGNDPEDADVMVENAIKKGNLLERSKIAHKRMEDSEKADIARIEKEHEESTRKQTETINGARNLLSTTIEKLEGFIVPETERPKLQNFIWDHLQMSPEGKLLIVQELNQEKIHKQIGSLLFQYMNGDLSQVIARKAETKAAQSLSKRNAGALKQPGNGSSNRSNSREYVPLTAVD